MPLIDPPAPAPAFSLSDQHGRTHTLALYEGRPLILFFYPKDLTPGCTAEACDFQQAWPDFANARAAVLGISILDPASKRKFADKHALDYPLLADDATDEHGKPHPVMSRAYGVWTHKSRYGRTYMGINRTTYLIAPDGRVAQRWDKVKVPGHVAAVLDAAQQLAR